MQPSTLSSTVPNGAPDGRAIDIDRRGRGLVHFAQCEPHHVALAADRLERAGRAAPCYGLIVPEVTSPSAKGSSVSIVATRPDPKPRPCQDRLCERERSCASPVVSWRGLAAGRKAESRLRHMQMPPQSLQVRPG